MHFYTNGVFKTMYRIFCVVFCLLYVSCSGSNFSSASVASKNRPAKEPVDNKTDALAEPLFPPGDIDAGGDRDSDEPKTDVDTGSVDIETEDILLDLDETNTCFLRTNGEQASEVTASGENCINNGVDPGGADFDDFHVTISGKLWRDNWEIFAAEDQEITINYRLGTPGSTRQDVTMQIVDCNREQKDSFVVSQGTGTRTLRAKKGDRFNIITTITSGCYGRKDVYDLIDDQLKAFRMD